MQSRNEGRTQKGVRCKESCVLFCFKMGEAPVYLLGGRNGPAEKGKLMTRDGAGVGVGGSEVVSSIGRADGIHHGNGGSPPGAKPTQEVPH